MKARVITRIIVFGKNRFKIDDFGQWWVLAFGHPIGHVGNPMWHWIKIQERKVPKEVKEQAK